MKQHAEQKSNYFHKRGAWAPQPRAPSNRATCPRRIVFPFKRLGFAHVFSWLVCIERVTPKQEAFLAKELQGLRSSANLLKTVSLSIGAILAAQVGWTLSWWAPQLDSGWTTLLGGLAVGAVTYVALSFASAILMAVMRPPRARGSISGTRAGRPAEPGDAGMFLTQAAAHKGGRFLPIARLKGFYEIPISVVNTFADAVGPRAEWRAFWGWLRDHIEEFPEQRVMFNKVFKVNGEVRPHLQVTQNGISVSTRPNVLRNPRFHQKHRAFSNRRSERLFIILEKYMTRGWPTTITLIAALARETGVSQSRVYRSLRQSRIHVGQDFYSGTAVTSAGRCN